MPWSHLEIVDCHGNYISELDDSLRLFPVVTLLDLSDNNLSSITTDLQYLHSIEILNFSFNQLRSLRPLLDPVVIPALARLTCLNIANNKLASLLGIECLSALTDLNAINNRIDCFDELR